MAMQDSTAVVLEQSFAKSHQLGLATADRANAGDTNVAEQTRLMFLQEQMKIGPREAMASQRLDSDKLAGAILQQRSAQDQPQVGVTGTTK